jgi:hypothetical protein
MKKILRIDYYGGTKPCYTIMTDSNDILDYTCEEFDRCFPFYRKEKVIKQYYRSETINRILYA